MYNDSTMIMLKKLTFAPFFLIAFSLLIPQINSLLASYDFIFSLSANSLIQLIKIAFLISLACLFFSLFVTLASDLKIILPVIILSALLPLLFLNTSLAIILVVTITISLFLTYLSLQSTLKSYLTFQPAALLGPAVRHLSGFLILSFCLIYFFSSSKIIAQNGFQIPDSLIDTALKMTPLPAQNQSGQTEQTQLPAISSDQIKLLKNNPELLKQSGIDPKLLDSLSVPQEAIEAPADLIKDTIKQTVKDQVQNFIKPYASFIPAVLTVLLFITLQSITSFINLLIYPLIWLTFLILEKVGFTKFTTEMRPVKKLMV
ncbi:MAG: hypothetical protein ACD_38C00044G0002 [uncultured bacterium]|nr:MAG: hypothetical protein ACD_38C00044G0002 [uncultured bacterium]